MKIYTTSRDDYLKAILVLQMQNQEVHAIDVAKYLGFSKPSVSHAVNLLSTQGYLYVDKDHRLHLTDQGREIAAKTYERHCFFTNHLIALGVDPQTAMEDACKIEHAISDESFNKIKEKYATEEDYVYGINEEF